MMIKVISVVTASLVLQFAARSAGNDVMIKSDLANSRCFHDTVFG